MRARRCRQREQLCRPPFGEGVGAHQKGVGLALDARQRHRAGQEAGCAARAAIVAGAEEGGALPRLERGGERPARFGGIISAAPCDRGGVDPARVGAQVEHAQPVLVDRHSGQADVLIDDVEPAAYAQAPRLRQDERIGAEQADDLGVRLDRQAGKVGARPSIGIAGAEAQPFAADAELVRRLHHLLLVEIGGRIEADRGEIAHAGQAGKARARIAAPAADVARPEILRIEVEGDGCARDGHFADDFAGNRAGAQRQPRVHARDVAREQQIAFCVGDIEHRRIVEPREIALQQLLVGARIAAHLDARHSRGQYVEPDDAVADRLRRHADRGEIALRPQDRCSAVANLAHRGNR